MTLNTDYAPLATRLLAALERFDCEIEPQGLYAAEEHGVEQPRQRWELEWTACIRPSLAAAGAVALDHARQLRLRPYPFRHIFYAAETGFTLPGFGVVFLTLIRVSSIKVRKYGNTFRIDPHDDFSERWSKLKFASYLKHARQDPSSSWGARSMLLLLGFDSHRDPLQQELSALHEERKWEHFGWNLHSRSWADPHKRAFFTRAALWTPQDSPSLPPAEASSMTPPLPSDLHNS